MPIENNTFPQSGDPDDAVRLAQLIGHDILTNTVRRGLEFTADFTAGELTIGEGVSHIGVDSDVATSDSEEIQDLGYVVQTAAETITLQDTGFYHVVIEPVLNTNDSPEINLYSDLVNASEYAFEIGTVDVDAEVVEEVNRDIGADIDHDNLIGGTSGNPHADSASSTDVDSEISSHKSNEVHDQPQPNQSHGNEDHSETYETETGAQSRVDSHESDTTGVHGVGTSDVESTSGAQSKADTAQSNAESFASSEVDDHRLNEVHDQPQPNQSHGNEDHSETYTTTGENVENFSTSGASNTVPVSQGDGTLSMQNVSQAIEFLDVESIDNLPDPGSVSKPTIAYVDSEDDYVGVFKQ